MKRFAQLFQTMDQTTRTSAKVAALADYFKEAPKDDRLWTIALFSGRRPKRTVTTTMLRTWAADHAGLPLWLVEESYPVVGDLAETIALILAPAAQRSDASLTSWIDMLRTMSNLPEENRKAEIFRAWDRLTTTERLVFNKLITGGFRVGISQKLMTRALAQATGKAESELAHRLMGNWTPDTTNWHDLIEANDASADASRPYPFYLAYGLDKEPGTLGPARDWRAEWKWDGIRGQLVVREGRAFLWSRGEELITGQFPEFDRCPDFIPDGTVLDGEILVWDGTRPKSFNSLQKRLGRKKVAKSLLRDAPAIIYAYDLLEWQGQDMRGLPFAQRRVQLQEAIGTLPEDAPVRLSPQVKYQDWGDLIALRENARDMRSEGLMLKRADSPYLSGRKKGDWWKWKLDPLSIDAVMIYAQSGHGRRSNLFTDFTFAVWSGNELVPFTKAYSGLTDAEFSEISAWVRRNTQKRFGPVRQVTPCHVFEIAFEGIHESPRHKSGVALRFPRMARWRRDKPMQEANTLGDLKEILHTYG